MWLVGVGGVVDVGVVGVIGLVGVVIVVGEVGVVDVQQQQQIDKINSKLTRAELFIAVIFLAKVPLLHILLQIQVQLILSALDWVSWCGENNKNGIVLYWKEVEEGGGQ